MYYLVINMCIDIINKIDMKKDFQCGIYSVSWVIIINISGKYKNAVASHFYLMQFHRYFSTM